MNGLSGSPLTNSSGYYSASVDYGWSGTVTPLLAGYTFVPSSSSYSNVTTNQSTNYTGTQLTNTISGYVRTSGGTGISGVTMNGLPGSPVTNSSGYYSATVNYGWSGTVTPILTGYSFVDASISYTNVTSDQVTNYTGTNIQTYTISGYVRTSAGVGISGVNISGFPTSIISNSSGNYSATVNYGWSGTITAVLTGYTFVAASTSYTNVTSDQTTNYTGTNIQTFTISGYVRTSAGVGISGVTLGGFPSSITTNSSGNYSATVNYGWSGMVTPTLTGYSFVAASTSYSNVTSDQTTNYTGTTVQTYVISGYVKTPAGAGINGVIMNGFPSIVTTSGGGNYSATVNSGWSGTVTPVLTGYTFVSASTSYENIASDQTTNYTGTIFTYTVSGFVRTAEGEGISGVAMNGFAINITTNSIGYYEATVNYGWTGIINPLLAGYIFVPISYSYINVTSNQTTNYIGNIKFIISDANGNTLHTNDTIKVPSDAGTLKLHVESTMDWSVSENSLWFKAVKENSSSIMLTYLENIAIIPKISTLKVRSLLNNEILLNVLQQPRISALRSSMQKFNNVKMYPNPAVSTIYLDMGNEKFDKVIISITNIQGNLLKTKEYKNLSGNQILEVSVSEFPTGQYWIQVGDEIYRKVFQLVKF